MLLSSRFSCGKFGADNALALVEAAKSGDNAEKALENLVERSSGFAINEAKNTAIAKLKPRLDPTLAKHGLSMEDITPVLDEIDSVDELVDAVSDPEAFFARLATDMGPAVSKKMAIAKLSPMLLPLLETQGLSLQEVRPILDKIDSLQDLTNAMDNLDGFVTKLVEKHHQGGNGPSTQRQASINVRKLLTTLWLATWLGLVQSSCIALFLSGVHWMNRILAAIVIIIQIGLLVLHAEIARRGVKNGLVVLVAPVPNKHLPPKCSCLQPKAIGSWQSDTSAIGKDRKELGWLSRKFKTMSKKRATTADLETPASQPSSIYDAYDDAPTSDASSIEVSEHRGTATKLFLPQSSGTDFVKTFGAFFKSSATWQWQFVKMVQQLMFAFSLVIATSPGSQVIVWFLAELVAFCLMLVSPPALDNLDVLTQPIISCAQMVAVLGCLHNWFGVAFIAIVVGAATSSITGFIKDAVTWFLRVRKAHAVVSKVQKKKKKKNSNTVEVELMSSG